MNLTLRESLRLQELLVAVAVLRCKESSDLSSARLLETWLCRVGAEQLHMRCKVVSKHTIFAVCSHNSAYCQGTFASRARCLEGRIKCLVRRLVP